MFPTMQNEVHQICMFFPRIRFYPCERSFSLRFRPWGVSISCHFAEAFLFIDIIIWLIRALICVVREMLNISCASAGTRGVFGAFSHFSLDGPEPERQSDEHGCWSSFRRIWQSLNWKQWWETERKRGGDREMEKWRRGKKPSNIKALPDLSTPFRILTKPWPRKIQSKTRPSRFGHTFLAKRWII